VTTAVDRPTTPSTSPNGSPARLHSRDTLPTIDADREPAGLEIVAKASAVISALEQHTELSAQELATITGEPLSSVFRLLRSLVAVGWVDRGVRRGVYRLGMYFMTVGRDLEDRLDVREASLPGLRALLAHTHATSFLCVPRGPRAVCVERLEGVAVRSLRMLLGDSLPLYAGAAPRAILAFLDDTERDTALASPPRPDDPPPPPTDVILADIRSTRRLGYAVSDGDVTPGIAALGAPVFNHRGDLVLALSISGLRAQILGKGKAANIRLLKAEAENVSQALGRPAQRVRR